MPSAGVRDEFWQGSVPPAALALTKRLESFRSYPYDDNGGQPGGTWTFGWGTTRDMAGAPVTAQSAPITPAIGETLLARDMNEAALVVHRNVLVILRTCEASALISWVYNLGEKALKQSHMLVVLNEEQRERVPAEMGRWIMQNGIPTLGLRRRRWAEGGIFVGMPPYQAIARAWAEIQTVADWPAYAG